MGSTRTPTPIRGDILADYRARIVARMSACPAAGDFSVQLATSRTRTTILADLSDTRAFLARILARMSVRDKLSCTCLQNYATGASLMSVSVSVSVPWNSSLTTRPT